MNGIRQRNFAVNYLLFGCIEASTGAALSGSVDIAWLWKKLSGKGQQYDCQLERWIYAGYVFCKFGIPISASMGASKGAPMPFSGGGIPKDANLYPVIGCPIADDPRYKHCDKCPSELTPEPFAFDLYHYLS